MTPQQFNEMYWAAQPKAIRALRELPTETERLDVVVALAAQGIKIDSTIVVLGYEPFGVMQGRQINGFEFYPAVGESFPPNAPAPGCGTPAQPDVPQGPAWGSIRVTLDPKHYPPMVEQADIPERPPLVGKWMAPLNGYDARNATTLKVGETAVAPDGSKIRLAEVAISPFAPKCKIWKKE